MQAELSEQVYQIESDGRWVAGRRVCWACRACPDTQKTLILFQPHDRPAELLWVDPFRLTTNNPNPLPAETQSTNERMAALAELDHRDHGPYYGPGAWE